MDSSKVRIFHVDGMSLDMFQGILNHAQEGFTRCIAVQWMGRNESLFITTSDPELEYLSKEDGNLIMSGLMRDPSRGRDVTLSTGQVVHIDNDI